MDHDIEIGGASVLSTLPVPLMSKIRYRLWTLATWFADMLFSFLQVRRRIWAMGLGIAAGVLVLMLSMLALDGTSRGADFLLVVDPPEGVRVVLDGAELLPDSQSPFRIQQLDQGRHFVTIEKPGYEDRQIDINVDPGESIYRGVLLKKIEGGFALDTEPVGATVWIDERPLEAKTPLITRGISPGPHMVRIAKGNEYAPKVIVVDVYQDKVTKVPFQRLQRKIVEVILESKPPGAVARLISGNTIEPIGRTPVKVTLDLSRRYRVRYDLNGYHSVNKQLNLEAIIAAGPSEEETLVYETVLPAENRPALASKSSRDTNSACVTDNPNRGTLSLQTQPWSRIYIDGQYVKNTPLVAHDIAPGTYDVTVKNPAFQILDKFQVSISCGKITKLTKTYI